MIIIIIQIRLTLNSTCLSPIPPCMQCQMYIASYCEKILHPCLIMKIIWTGPAPLFELTLPNYSWSCNQRILGLFHHDVQVIIQVLELQIWIILSTRQRATQFQTIAKSLYSICLRDEEEGENPTTIENLWQDYVKHVE